MEQMLPTSLDEGQIAKLIDKHEVKTADIVGTPHAKLPLQEGYCHHLLRLQCPCHIFQINRTVLA
jgi:hypothetical protein